MDKAFAVDEVAVRIIEANAKAQVDNVVAVATRLGLAECRLALLGGLFEHDTNFRRCFIDILGKVRPDLNVAEPLHNAAEGALLVAEADG